MIKAQNLSYRYGDGTLGLDGLDLKISQGEFVAVIGRSGSGKTTFLRQVNGFLKPTSGTLEVLDRSVGAVSSGELRKLRTHIGFIFQQFNLIKRLTVLQNVLAGRLGYHGIVSATLGLFSDEDKTAARHYIREVGLEGREHSLVEKLSGGQQQRVAIARAFVQNPKIILADEPMASLDPRLSDVVLGLLKTFNQTQKASVVVNIHVVDLARRYASRVVGLKAGRKVFDGPVENLTDPILKMIYE